MQTSERAYILRRLGWEEIYRIYRIGIVVGFAPYVKIGDDLHKRPSPHLTITYIMCKHLIPTKIKIKIKIKTKYQYV
jgi:hypothetical protein